MEHSPSHARQDIEPPIPRPHNGQAYQNLPEPPEVDSRPSSPQNGGNRDTPNTSNQSQIRRRSKSRPIRSFFERETPAEAEVRKAVDHFMDKCSGNQFYMLLLFLIGASTSKNSPEYAKTVQSNLILLAVVYIVHLLIIWNRKQTKMNSLRTTYKIFEFAAAVIISSGGTLESRNLLAGSLLGSYLIKIIMAYYSNQSALVKVVNQVNKTVLLIRIFIFIQGVLLLVQQTAKNPILSKLLFLPIWIILLIVLGFTLRLLHSVFYAYKPQNWISNSCDKTKAELWIFGNLVIIFVLLLWASFIPDSTSEDSDSAFCFAVVTWCGCSLFLVVHAKDAVHEIFRALVNKLEPSQAEDKPKYVLKISNSYYKIATDQEIAEINNNRNLSGGLSGEEDIEVNVENNSAEAVKCVVCFRKSARAMFMACGHGGVCFTCARKINENQKECHLCRQKILGILVMDIKKNKGNLYEVVEEIINRD